MECEKGPDERICEISASKIRGCSLNGAMRRLKTEEKSLVKEKWRPRMAERRRKAKEKGKKEGERGRGRESGREKRNGGLSRQSSHEGITQSS